MTPFAPHGPLAVAAALLLALALPLAAAEDTVYDVLRNHGLPMGLLPKGVAGFAVDADGNFEVRLDQPCTAKFENEVRYEANVSGTISYGRIRALRGISAQELFLWFPVKGIRVDVPSSGIIYFDVGVIYKQFSVSLFEVPPDCLDLDGGRSETRALLRERKGIAVRENKSGKLQLDKDITEKASM